MRKLTLVVAVLTASLLLQNCSDDEQIFNNESKQENVRLKTELVPHSTKDVAFNFATYLSGKPSMLNALNEAISQVVRFGLDENLTVYDVLKTENSVFFNDTQLTEQVKDAFNENDLAELGFNANNFYGGLNIYWGYHDDWDGKTIPVIGFLDETTTETKINGFQITKEGLKDVIISADEFDDVAYPVIIINFSEIEYSNYPNFKDGERVKNGVEWPEAVEQKDETKEEYNEWTDPKKIYKTKFTSFVVNDKHQYDYFWAGGSEFKLETAYVRSSDNQATKAMYAFNFSRKEIKKRKTKSYDNIINSDWQAEYENMYIYLIEEDGGDYGEIEVNLSISGVGSLELKLPKHNLDDEIGRSSILRHSYIADLSQYLTYIICCGDCRIGTRMIVQDRPY